MELPLKEVAEFIGANVRGAIDALEVRSISTDTRTMRGGELFVALRGASFDGHEFSADAIKAGALALVVDHEIATRAPVPQLVVPDTLYALGEIARLWRRKLGHVKIIAIVGSSGKTTVKEMTASVIGRARSTLATQGNLNNLVGVPLTLFRLEPSHEAAVVELGMNAPGELRRLVEIAEPNGVVLTNIRDAHVGMFQSPEELYLAKTDSLRHAPPEAFFVLNADDPASQRAYRECTGNHYVIRYGFSPDADVRAVNVAPLVPFGYAFDLVIRNASPIPTQLHMFGQHNVLNALAAAAASTQLGIEPAVIAESLREFRPAQNRSEVEQIANVFFVKDYYNASPAAVEAALLSLRDFHVPGRRFAVLGDMLELGAWEHAYHERIGAVAATEAGLTKLFCYGPRSKVTVQAALARGLAAEHFDDHEELARAVLRELGSGDLVLIKGSRLMKLERVFEYLKGALLPASQ